MAEDHVVPDEEEVTEPVDEEEDALSGESSLADHEVTDDQDIASEPHAIAAE